jgi:hypothetical protein
LHTFRRIHVFGQAGTGFPGSAQDVRTAGNVGFLKDSRAGWIKLWASWAILQPRAASDPIGTGPALPPKNQDPATHLQAIDDQITFIRTHPDPAISRLKIILSLRECPLWATVNFRASVANTPYEHKGSNEIYLAFPDKYDVSSPWAAYVGWVVDRYTRTAANPNRYVDGIDIINEPNTECWPQQSGSKVNGQFVGTPNSHCIVAQMFGSAVVRREAAVGNLGQSTQVLLKPLLLGPGTADFYLVDDDGTPHDTDTQTTYLTFNNNLLALLHALRFTAPIDFIWSHHNYNDTSYDLGVGTTDPPTDHAKRAPHVNRAQHARRLLVGRWSGGPYGDLNAPYLFITEGGVHRNPKWAAVWSLANTNTAWNAKHGELMLSMLRRMQNESDGKGIGMVSQFLFYTDHNYDSGICDPRPTDIDALPSPSDGAKRQPAFDYWAGAPSYGNVR